MYKINDKVSVKVDSWNFEAIVKHVEQVLGFGRNEKPFLYYTVDLVGSDTYPAHNLPIRGYRVKDSQITKFYRPVKKMFLAKKAINTPEGL